MPESNETSSNESPFSQHLPLFWPVRQSRAAVEQNLSLSQNTADIHIVIHTCIMICTVFPQIVSAETILFWKLECSKYSWEETIQGRKLLGFFSYMKYIPMKKDQ